MYSDCLIVMTNEIIRHRIYYYYYIILIVKCGNFSLKKKNMLFYFSMIVNFLFDLDFHLHRNIYIYIYRFVSFIYFRIELQ